MKLRKADCGHWVNFDLPQAGTQDVGPHVWPIYLCAECRRRALATDFERKDLVVTGNGAEEFEQAVTTKVAGRTADGKFKSRED